MTCGTTSDISVIGRCRVASCRRPAAVHIILPGPHGVAGAVCERCGRVSALAGFLLELMAA
jgi:hypothetical protein